MTQKPILLSVLLATASTVMAAADVHFDLSPVVQDGKIVTEGVTHASVINPFTGIDTSPNAYNYWAPEMRVFGYEMGEDPLFPRSTEDPGINRDHASYLTSGGTVTLAGTGLPLSSTLNFTVIGALQQWTGTGYVQADAGASLDVIYGSTRTLTGLTGALVPLPIKTFVTSTDVHLHLEAELSASTLTGIYMFPAELQSSSGSIANSLPFWVVYNYGDTEEAHGAAMNYVQANYVPEPAFMSVLGAVAMLTLRRRWS